MLRPLLVDPVQRKIGCPRGRHRDAHVLADALVGPRLGDDFPALALCERWDTPSPGSTANPPLEPDGPSRPGSLPP